MSFVLCLSILLCLSQRFFGVSGVSSTQKYTKTGIGMNLWTSKATIGVVNLEKTKPFQVVPNKAGEGSTPTYIGFSSSGSLLLGQDAIDEADENPENVVFNPHRLFGHSYKEIETYAKLLPYSVVNSSGRPYISLTIGGLRRELAPEELYSLLLRELKEDAEKFLSEEVTYVVASVPVNLTAAESYSLQIAGELAGLEIGEVNHLDFLNSFDFEYQYLGPTIFIYIGSSYCNVVVRDLTSSKTRAFVGDSFLGGEDFTQRVMNYYIQEFKKKHYWDITNNKKALHKLRKAAETAKIELSTAHKTDIKIKGLLYGIDLADTLTRPKFEKVNDDLFERVLELVKTALIDAGETKHSIQHVVLMGESANIPKLHFMIKSFFGKEEKVHFEKGIDMSMTEKASMIAYVDLGKVYYWLSYSKTIAISTYSSFERLDMKILHKQLRRNVGRQTNKHDIQAYVKTLKELLNKFGKVVGNVRYSDKKKLEDVIEETNYWILEYPNASSDIYDLKLKQLKDTCDPILGRVYQADGTSFKYRNDL